MEKKLYTLVVTSTLKLLLINSATNGAAIGDNGLVKRDATLDNGDQNLETCTDDDETKRGIWDNYVPDWTSSIVLVRKRDTEVAKNQELHTVQYVTNRDFWGDALNTVEHFMIDLTSQMLKDFAHGKRNEETRAVNDQAKRGIWDNYVPDWTSSSVFVRKRDSEDSENQDVRTVNFLTNRDFWGDAWQAAEPVLVDVGAQLLKNLLLHGKRNEETSAVNDQIKRGIWDNYVPDWTSSSVLVRKRDSEESENEELRAVKFLTNRDFWGDAWKAAEPVLVDVAVPLVLNLLSHGKRNEETRAVNDEAKRGIWDNYVPDWTSSSVLVRKRDVKDSEDLDNRVVNVLTNRDFWGDAWHAVEPVLLNAGVKWLSNALSGQGDAQSGGNLYPLPSHPTQNTFANKYNHNFIHATV